jgi:hypothetical protein
MSPASSMIRAVAGRIAYDDGCGVEWQASAMAGANPPKNLAVIGETR